MTPASPSSAVPISASSARATCGSPTPIPPRTSCARSTAWASSSPRGRRRELRVSAEIGHMDVRIILAALAVLGVLPCWAQNDSSGAPKQSGAWRIDSVQDAGSKEENFSLLTTAVGNTDATFSLWCKPDVPLYYFAIRHPRLAELPSGQETTVTVRVGDREPVRFLAASAGGGS